MLTILAKYKAQLRAEHERRATKYGHLTEEGEKLLKAVPLRTCLQHITRTGEEPALWSLNDDEAARLSVSQSIGSWFRPVCHQSYRITTSGNFHTHWLVNGSMFLPPPDSATILQCERCCALFDIRLRPFTGPMDCLKSEIRLLSFVQCPKNIGGECEKNKNYSWARRQTQLHAERDECLAAFEPKFLHWDPQNIADHVFYQRPKPGAQEVHKAYLAWRKIWHTQVFRPQAIPLSTTLASYLSGMRYTLESLRLWGDVINDGRLYQERELDKKALVYTYDQDPESVEYLAVHHKKWVNECRWLNDYVGRRRSMTTDQYNLAKKAVQRAGTAMTRLVAAEVALKDDPTPQNRHIRDNLEMDARTRFQEIKSAVLADPTQLYRRVDIEGCRAPFHRRMHNPLPHPQHHGAGRVSAWYLAAV